MATNGQNRPYVNIFLDVRRKGAPQYLAKRIEGGLERGFSIFKIKVPFIDSAIYPSMCVPLAGIIDFYARRGCVFLSSSSLTNCPYLRKTCFMQPKVYSSSMEENNSFLDIVWKFSKESLFEIVSGLVHSVRRSMLVEPGVLEGFELCLTEITDNVLVHSISGEQDSSRAIGFVMAQIHQENSTIVVSVYDGGQGILSSFQGSEHSPETPEEAIELALRKNVTSGFGQGRGMWMLSSIVEFGKGTVEIVSDKARYSLAHRDEIASPKPVFSKISAEIEGTTLVDFWIDASKEIDIKAALHGYNPTNLWLENHENNSEDLCFYVKEESRGTGSRYAAKQFRNILLNAANQSSQKIVVNFSDIEIVSSSYADELFGKMIAEIGLVSFMSRFRLVGINKTNAFIIDEAVMTRLAQEKGSVDEENALK